MARGLAPIWILIAGMACLGQVIAQPADYEPLTVRVEPRKLAPRTYFVQGDSGPISTSNNGYN
ncbi:MAG: hypothetical protein VW339_14500, partial [Quisquiliibacterium sp.]